MSDAAQTVRRPALNKLDALEKHIAAAATRCWPTQQPGRSLGVRARSRCHHPGRICAAACIISARPPIPNLERKIGVYLRRIQGAHGGWPLFHDGDFDMSASVKAYFALKMIGDDIDAPHMKRAREAILARGGAVKSTSSPARCLRSSA